MANATHNQILNALANYAPSIAWMRPARVEFVLGLICLPSVFFAIIEIQARRAREVDQARVGSGLPSIRAGFARCAGSMESLWTIPVGAFGRSAVRA